MKPENLRQPVDEQAAEVVPLDRDLDLLSFTRRPDPCDVGEPVGRLLEELGQRVPERTNADIGGVLEDLEAGHHAKLSHVSHEIALRGRLPRCNTRLRRKSVECDAKIAPSITRGPDRGSFPARLRQMTTFTRQSS